MIIQHAISIITIENFILKFTFIAHFYELQSLKKIYKDFDIHLHSFTVPEFELV